jgi:hypothetical protein
MPRWPIGYIRKNTCSRCGGKKDYEAKFCRSCAPKAQSMRGRKRDLHPAWKGGQFINDDGYVMTLAPDHPWPRASRYILEHVRLMELAIGRRLRRGEVVHHVDHNRRNNVIANLAHMSAADHSTLHRALDAGSRLRNRGKFAKREAA